LHQRDWDARLLIFLLAYRASTHDTTGLTPTSLVFGRELQLPCDLLFGVYGLSKITYLFVLSSTYLVSKL
jgi:hypothetical protein